MKHYQNQRPQKAINFCSVKIARLAQSVEHGTLNPRVVGSGPTLGGSFEHKITIEKSSELVREMQFIKSNDAHWIPSKFRNWNIVRLAQSVEHATLNPRLVGSRSTLAIVLSTESHYKEKLCGADKTVAFTNRYIG